MNKKLEKTLEAQEESKRLAQERSLAKLKKERSVSLLNNETFLSKVKQYVDKRITCRELFLDNGVHFYRINVYGSDNYILRSFFVSCCFNMKNELIKTIDIKDD